MVRGTRSGRAGSSNPQLEETTNGGDMGTMVDSETTSGLKRSRSRLDSPSCHQPYMRGPLIHITVFTYLLTHNFLLCWFLDYQ